MLYVEAQSSVHAKHEIEFSRCQLATSALQHWQATSLVACRPVGSLIMSVPALANECAVAGSCRTVSCSLSAWADSKQ
jgi:hypothetical protein